MKSQIAGKSSRAAERSVDKSHRWAIRYLGLPTAMADAAIVSVPNRTQLHIPSPTRTSRYLETSKSGLLDPEADALTTKGDAQSAALIESRADVTGFNRRWAWGIVAVGSAVILTLLPMRVWTLSVQEEKKSLKASPSLADLNPLASPNRRFDSRNEQEKLALPTDLVVAEAELSLGSPNTGLHRRPNALPVDESRQSKIGEIRVGTEKRKAEPSSSNSSQQPVTLRFGDLSSVARTNVARSAERRKEQKPVDVAAVDHADEAASNILQTLDGPELKQSLRLNAQPIDLFHSDESYIEAVKLIAARQQPARPVVLDQSTRIKISKLQSGLVRAKVMARKNPEKREAVRELEEKLASLFANASQAQRSPQMEPIKQIVPHRDDLAGLPWSLDGECRLDENAGTSMHEISQLMTRAPGRLSPASEVDVVADGYAPSGSLIQVSLERCDQVKDLNQALSTIDQVLQVDYPAHRIELIDALQKRGTKDAMERIANRAKYDLVSKVRHHAADALKQFPIESVRKQLLEGLHYPWPAVAQHSAEALVRLEDHQSVPQLMELLESPDPRLPVRQSNGRYVARELVSINHMRNCLMCHAPSESPADYGRAATPSILEPPPQRYYQPSTSEQGFVRADVTYLKQDFSVQQSVENPGPWPRVQRFDYVVRERSMGSRERSEIEDRIMAEPNPYRQAIRYALRALTMKPPVVENGISWQQIPVDR